MLYYLVLVDEPKGQPSVAPVGHAVCQARHFKRLPCLILVQSANHPIVRPAQRVAPAGRAPRAQ